MFNKIKQMSIFCYLFKLFNLFNFFPHWIFSNEQDNDVFYQTNQHKQYHIEAIKKLLLLLGLIGHLYCGHVDCIYNLLYKLNNWLIVREERKKKLLKEVDDNNDEK